MEEDFQKIANMKDMKDQFAQLKKRLEATPDAAYSCKLQFGVLSFAYLLFLVWHTLQSIRIFMQNQFDLVNGRGPRADSVVTQSAILMSQVYSVLSLMPSLLQSVYSIILFVQRDDAPLLQGKVLTNASIMISLAYLGHMGFHLVWTFVFNSKGSFGYAMWLFYHDYLLLLGPAVLYGVLTWLYIRDRQAKINLA